MQKQHNPALLISPATQVSTSAASKACQQHVKHVSTRYSMQKQHNPALSFLPAASYRYFVKKSKKSKKSIVNVKEMFRK
jgi:hypothetical protein